MAQLADGIHLLRIYVQLLQDDVWFSAVMSAFRIAFCILYSLFLLSDGYFFPLFLVVGFLLGIAFLSTNKNWNALAEPSFDSRLPRHFQAVASDNEEMQIATDKRNDSLVLFYGPLTTAMDRLIDYFHRDFVLSWWSPLNVNHDTTFEKIVRATLNSSVSNIEKILLKQERNDLVMATVYGVANVLIIHMREYRNFETSGLALTDYIEQNPHSPFAQLITEEEQHRQMRALSATIIKRIFPPNDTQSPIVMSMMTELLATYLFGSILQACSDPDFINRYIVDYLSQSDTDGKNTNGTSQLDDGQGLDGIRSALERAAESLIAANQVDDSGTDPKNKLSPDAAKNVTDTQQAVCQRQEISHPNTPRQSTSTDTHTLSPKDSSLSNETSPHRKDDSSIKKDTKSYDATAPIAESPVSGNPASLPPISESDLNGNKSPRSSPATKKKLSVPRIEESLAPTTMVFAPGTVSFSIMDISAFGSDGSRGGQPAKNKMMFMVQIERSAPLDNSGSEGGGYVITRTYTDFEVFHAIISARHAKRVARANLRLPLDPIRSWLKLGAGVQAPPVATDSDTICRHLEMYLSSVVQDSEVGRDQIILAFLRKERRVPVVGDKGEPVDVSFADEYMDEVGAYTALSERTLPGSVSSAQSSMGKAMSMLARAPSLAAKSVSSSFAEIGYTGLPSFGEGTVLNNGDLVASPTQELPRRWFNRRSARQGSVSSLLSNNSSSGREDTSMEEDQDTHSSHEHASSPPSSLASSVVRITEEATEEPSRHSNSTEGMRSKPLTALDIELLIETTFALVIEIFDLTTANNRAWMRRTLLNLLREIVRRSYTEIIAEQYSAYINDYLSPEALTQLCDQMTQLYWPDGQWADAYPERTAEEKEKTCQQAQALLLTAAVPSGVRQLIGDQNCSAAMDRLWSRCQNPALNRVLLLQILERSMRPIFG